MVNLELERREGQRATTRVQPSWEQRRRNSDLGSGTTANSWRRGGDERRAKVRRRKMEDAAGIDDTRRTIAAQRTIIAR